jgi:hypothetical protein
MDLCTRAHPCTVLVRSVVVKAESRRFFDARGFGAKDAEGDPQPQMFKPRVVVQKPIRGQFV